MNHKLTKTILFCFLVACAYINSSNAQIYCSATNGTILLTGTQTGVYQVSDNGNTWTPLNKGIEGKFISYLSASGSRWIARGKYNELFLSENNGISWETVKTDKDQSITSAIIDETDIYIGTYSNGLFKSSDKGLSWIEINKGLKELSVNSIYKQGTTLYTFVQYDGLFSSADNGGQWKKFLKSKTTYGIRASTINGSGIFIGNVDGEVFRVSNNGELILSNRTYYPINTIAMNDSVIFTGSDYGIDVSYDKGENWSYIENKTAKKVNSLLIFEKNIFGIFGEKLFVSTNNGLIWNEADEGLKNIQEAKRIKEHEELVKSGKYAWWKYDTPGQGLVETFARIENMIFVGNFYGVYASAYKGTNWKAVNDGLPENPDVRSLAVNGTTLFAASAKGLFLSSNAGNSWEKVNKNENGLSEESFTSVVVSENNVFVSTKKGVYLSANNGISWGKVSNGLSDSCVFALAVMGNNIYAGTEHGLFLSTDMGSNWVLHGSNTVVDPSYISEYDTRIVSSTDLRFQRLRIFSLAVCGNNLVVGTESSGHTTSKDGGNTWSELKWEEKDVMESSNEGLDVCVAAYFVKTNAEHRRWLSYNRQMVEWMKELNARCQNCNGKGTIWHENESGTRSGFVFEGYVLYRKETTVFDPVRTGEYKCPVCLGSGKK